MSNDYFNHTSPLARHTLARSTAVNTLMTAVQAGFAKLPGEAILNQGRVTYCADTGSANAYAVALPKTLTSYAAGLTIDMMATNTNTGAATLNADSLGARSIKRIDGTDPEAGDITAGYVYEFVYDGTNFLMQTPSRVHMAGIANNLAANLNFTGNPIFSGNPAFTGAPTFVGMTVNGNIAVTGNVDGRDVATDGAKLDGIEAGATADQTGAEIKALYEAESDTNAFTDAEKAKVGHLTVTQAVNLDQMETDIAALANGMVYKGDWDASAGSFPGAGAAQTGWFYYVSTGGTVDGVAFTAGDNLVATTDNASTTTYSGNWSKHDQTDAVQSVVGLTGSISKGSLLAALNVEDGADVTDTANVTSAGALMDSELTNIAAVKALNQGLATTDTPYFARLGVGTSPGSGVHLHVLTTDTTCNVRVQGDASSTISLRATSNANYNLNLTQAVADDSVRLTMNGSYLLRWTGFSNPDTLEIYNSGSIVAQFALGAFSTTGNYTMSNAQPTIQLVDTDGTTQYGQVLQAGANTVIRSRNDATNGGVVIAGFGGGVNTNWTVWDSTGLATFNNGVAFGTHSAIGAETITGYITVKDSGGTSRKLAVVS